MVFSGDIRFKDGGEGVELGRRDGEWSGSNSENQGAMFRPRGSRGVRDACREEGPGRKAQCQKRARKGWEHSGKTLRIWDLCW